LPYFFAQFEAIWNAMERRYAGSGLFVPPLPTKVHALAHTSAGSLDVLLN
jgi:hypothetical protein